MSEQKKLVSNTVDEIKETIDLFYQNKNNDALNKFSVVIGLIMEAVDALALYKNTNSEFIFDEVKVVSILKDAMEALEKKDLVLLADILQYDFVEYIEQLLDSMD